MKKWGLISLGLAVGILLGYLAGRLMAPGPGGADGSPVSVPAVAEATVWTCSMHPQIRQPKPGKCPICFMDLIPVKGEGNASAAGTGTSLHWSPEQVHLARVETAPVEKKVVTVDVDLQGMIEYDESRVAYITARVAGRIDRLYVNFTGTAVRKGEHLAEYYSPDLLVSQMELLQNAKALADDLYAKKTYDLTVKKLKLWGLSEESINHIIETGTVADHITLYSPIDGIVMKKDALEGKYFATGDPIFTVGDLAHLWVILDAYEDDIAFIRYGQKVDIHVKAYPGKSFPATVSFLAPDVNMSTRTFRVRVNIDNAAGLLKPGMFVTGAIHAKIAKGGKIFDDSLSGKWICQMHPEIVKDVAGTCDVCGMDLVPAESLGYVSEAPTPSLLIPVSAPLVTGDTATVYVETAAGVYEPRQVVLGPRAGEYYLVSSGLAEGDVVVTHGAFLIDSDLQIKGKPSMMEPAMEKMAMAPAVEPPAALPQANRTDLMGGALGSSLREAYYEIGTALFEGDAGKAKAAGEVLAKKLTAAPAGPGRDSLLSIAGNLVSAADIHAQRIHFAALGAGLEKHLDLAGLKSATYKLFCPMAFDNQGAFWLQPDADTRNPFFGSVMPKCGELKQTFGPKPEPRQPQP